MWQHLARRRRENGLSMRVSQTPARPGNTLFLPYKEGVAGSNLASPTKEEWHFADKIRSIAISFSPATIRAATISGRTSERTTGVAAHRYHPSTIILEIDAWMPSEYVRQAYHNVQYDLLGENNRQPELRNVEVFRFVVTHSELQI